MFTWITVSSRQEGSWGLTGETGGRLPACAQWRQPLQPWHWQVGHPYNVSIVRGETATNKLPLTSLSQLQSSISRLIFLFIALLFVSP